MGVDVTDVAAVERAVLHAEQHLGPVDLLVNNAGRIEAAGAAVLAVPTSTRLGRGRDQPAGADGDDAGSCCRRWCSAAGATWST